MGFGAFHPRHPLFAHEQTLECAEDSAHYSQQRAVLAYFFQRRARAQRHCEARCGAEEKPECVSRDRLGLQSLEASGTLLAPWD
jgi:hypothetical protein